MPVISWISWFATSIIVAIFAVAFSRKLKFKRFHAIIIATLAAVSVFGTLSIYRDYAKPTPVNVVITSPSTGARLEGYRVQVTGTVFPPDALVTVVIRSETDLKWWVQTIVKPEPIDDNKIGKWTINGYIGTDKAGINKNFYIIALASADNVLFNLLTGRTIAARTSLKNIPLWSQSEPVVIRRIK